MRWYLRKDWEDADDGIDAVVIHHTTTPRGEEPDWGRDHVWRPLLDHGGLPRRRSKVLALPTAVWSDYHGGWDVEFLLHHYFEVYQHGARWSTPTYTEEIVSKPLEFVDPTGLITNICIHWAVGDWEAPTYSPMEEYRFPADSPFASVRYYGYQDKDRYHHEKAQMLAQIDRPHHWQGRMWGPAGARLLQQYHIGRMYPDEEKAELFYGPEGPTAPCADSWVHEL
jgi:hypothetical protein